MRHVLWAVALMEACDVTKRGRHLGHHLGFYQELTIVTDHHSKCLRGINKQLLKASGANV